MPKGLWFHGYEAWKHSPRRAGRDTLTAAPGPVRR